MRDKIYYLLDFHKKCINVVNYDDIINKYCNYVNTQLNKYFSIEQQLQLKLHNFNYNLLNKIAFENISFDNLDEELLCIFFDEISFIGLKIFN